MWRIAVILVAGALAYANALHTPFIYDDTLSVVSNEHIRTLQLPDVLVASRENPAAGRPIVNLSFAINYAAGGLNPTGYHLVNIAIHALCGLLLFAVARRTFGSDNVALATALLWVVHPLNSETVDYVTQRSESLMALCFLLTLYCSIRSAERSGRAMWSAAAVAACAAGMGAKETMAVVPIVIVLYDRAFTCASWTRAFRQRWPLYAGLGATWILLAALLWSGPRMHSAGFASGVSPWTYLLNQTVMIARYLRLAFWPRDLVLAYGWPRALTLSDVWPQALLVAGLIVLTGVAAARSARLAFAGAFFFLFLAPTSSIVPIATEVGAERRMYLPLVAIVALLVLAVDALRKRWRVPAAATAALLAVSSAGLIAGTLDRNREYASQRMIAETVHDRWPSPMATAMVGLELRDEGRVDEAIDRLRQAGAEGYPPAWYHAGGLLMNAGRVDEAVVALQTFIEQAPMAADGVSARLMLGRAFLARHQVHRALAEAEQARAMDRGNVDAVGLLADACLAAGQIDRAVAMFQPYLANRPGDFGATLDYGVALASSGRPREAMAAFKRARELDPRDGRPYKNLAALLLNSNDIDAAGRAAMEAVKVAPSDAQAHDLLGRALAGRGQLAEARAEFERAIAIDPQFAQARSDLETLTRATR